MQITVGKFGGRILVIRVGSLAVLDAVADSQRRRRMLPARIDRFSVALTQNSSVRDSVDTLSAKVHTVIPTGEGCSFKKNTSKEHPFRSNYLPFWKGFETLHKYSIRKPSVIRYLFDGPPYAEPTLTPKTSGSKWHYDQWVGVVDDIPNISTFPPADSLRDPELKEWNVRSAAATSSRENYLFHPELLWERHQRPRDEFNHSAFRQQKVQFNSQLPSWRAAEYLDSSNVDSGWVVERMRSRGICSVSASGLQTPKIIL
ncbi:hypothetical protein B0H14DRAFT_3145638 [Mycena olivaceomarginata]|nr:hypothetical protein B0H14DRAFT_3145638 [Mycena olivaceomarginata]